MAALIGLLACRTPPASPPVPTEIGAEAQATTAMAPTWADDRLAWLAPAGGAHAFVHASATRRAVGAHTPIAAPSGLMANWADTPLLHRGSAGWLAVVPVSPDSAHGHAYDLRLYVSSDGNAWTDAGLLHRDGTVSEHGFVSMTDHDATTWAFWLDGRQTVSEGPMTLRAAPVGAYGAGESVQLDDRVCDCCGTDAATTSSGPIVVYRDRVGAEIRDISIVRRQGDAWTTPRRVASDGWEMPGCPVNGPRVVAHQDEVTVAWFTAAGGPRIHLARSSDGGRTFDPPVRVDDGAPVGRVDLVGDDRPVLVWLTRAGEVRARRVDESGIGASVLVGTADPGRRTGFPRARIAGDTLQVVWTDSDGLVFAEPVPLSRLAPPRTSTVPAAPSRPLPSTFPALAMTTPAGEAATLPEGEVLVNLWATWCGPCRRELPVLAAWAEQHPDVPVIGIAIDDEARAIRRQKVPYPVFMAESAAVGAALGAVVVPTTLLIRDGAILWHHVGAVESGQLPP